jgi:hypothetical protein
LPFFKLLKALEKFVWSKEADAAFMQLKEFLTSPSVLTAPQKDDVLLLYIAATARVVSTVIVVEREEPGHVYKVQRLFTSSARCSMSPKPSPSNSETDLCHPDYISKVKTLLRWISGGGQD